MKKGKFLLAFFVLMALGFVETFSVFGENIIELAAPNGAADDEFGAATVFSPDGRTLFVGAPGFNEKRGAIYVFRYDGSSWTLVQAFYDPNGQPGDRLGDSLAVGDQRLFAGAWGAFEERGSIYTLLFDQGSLTLEDILFASDGQSGDRLGGSLSSSSDGNSVVASSFLTGKAYVFEKIQVRSKKRGGVSEPSLTWAETILTIPNPEQAWGLAVGISPDGTKVAIGSECNSDDPSRLALSGASYIFSKKGRRWSKPREIIPSDSQWLGFFGRAIAIRDDGTLFVGTGKTKIMTDEKTRETEVKGGAVCIYPPEMLRRRPKPKRSKKVTTLQEPEPKKLYSDSWDFDFGNREIVFSHDGHLLVGTQNGAYLYARDAEGNYAPENVFLSSAVHSIVDLAGSSALSSEGNTVAIGSPGATCSSGEPNCGLVTLFTAR